MHRRLIDKARLLGTADQALAALRELLGASEPNDQRSVLVAAALQRVCDCAHRDRMLPEAMVVQLKKTLDMIPAFNSTAPSLDARSRIVGLAIHVYFAPRMQPATG